MRIFRFSSGLTLLLLSAAALNALAAEPAKPAATSPFTAAPAAAARAAVAVDAKPTYVDGFGQSVAGVALATLSGGTNVTETMTLNGTVSNNTADHVVTGSNSISTGSFNGAAGVPMVIQNTGNNVLIQNATIINVQFQP
jgi:hypothetical protein